MTDPQELVIDRSKWLRGERGSMLLRPTDGKMCCLGFFGLACGYLSKDIEGEGSPEMTDKSHWPEWLLYPREERDGFCDSTDCNALMAVNDETALPESEREAQIAALFAKHGVTVRFVDGADQ